MSTKLHDSPCHNHTPPSLAADLLIREASSPGPLSWHKEIADTHHEPNRRAPSEHTTDAEERYTQGWSA